MTCIYARYRLTIRLDLTADAPLFPLRADPADQKVHRVGTVVDLGLKTLFYLQEFGGYYAPRSSPT